MGISYFGASTPSQPLSVLFQLLLISWNFTAFAYSYYTFYVSTTPPPPVSDLEFHNSSNSEEASFLGQKALTPLVNYIRLSSLFVYFCFSYILNLYMGAVSRSLVKLLRDDLYPLLDSEAEHRIGTGIALVQVLDQFIIIKSKTNYFNILRPSSSRCSHQYFSCCSTLIFMPFNGTAG